ncbi:hypothetical protein K1719_046981 [Acacia pycnantha]|nr:hypothetical protein K1719_046981 [Acacia pycnantha]
MRSVQEMAVEFVNALNAAAAAAAVSECAKLRRLLEEERKLVHRLKEEKEDEAEMAKRKIERMSQRLAGAQNDVEYATARADVAENEWVKLKRELREAQELVQLLKPEGEETRQIVLRQGDDKELELANALNAASVAESECDKLRTLLEEERKLVQRLIGEKEDEAQLGKRQIEEIGQELTDARKDAEYATSRADVAEIEWIKAKKELQEEKLLKPECDEIRQSAMRQVEEMERELVNALHASTEIAERELGHARKDAELARKDADAAESECANLKRMLIEEGKTVQRLKIEKDDEAEQAKREIEKMGRELAYTRKDAQHARNDADIAENEWTKVKREVKEKEELIKLLKLEIQEISQVTVIQIEEISQDLEHARNEAEHALNEAEHARNEAEHARNEAEHAQNDADIAQNEWIKATKDLQEKLELIQMLKLECQETSERAMRQVEEKELELADTLNAVTSASSSSSVAQDCAICLTNEKDLAFGCGHVTCEECGKTLSTCPICREHITIRIKLFPG